MILLRKYHVNIILVILLIFAVFLYSSMQLQKIFLVGFYSADDSYFAMISKRLLESGVYGFPTTNNITIPFDPYIGSGPALILLGALGIKLFGIAAWAPGLISQAATFLLISAAVGILSSNWGRRSLFVVAMLALITVYTAQMDVLWQFMGEPTMVGYLFLAVAILAQTAFAPSWRLATVGLLFGVAILSKPIALFFAIGVSAAWTITALARRGLWQSIRCGLVLMLATGLPLASFELYKIFILGVGGYIDLERQSVQVTEKFHVGPSDRFLEMVSVLNHYQIGISIILGLVLAGAIIFYARAREESESGVPFNLFLLLMAGCVAHMVYFLFLSRMSLRYFFVIPFFVSIAMATPALLRLRFAVPMVVVIFAFIATPATLHNIYTYQTRRADGSVIAEKQAVLDLVNTYPDLPVFGQSWHSFLDIAFQLPDGRRWFTTSDEREIPNITGIAVFNVNFVGREYPMYKQVLKSCKVKLKRLKYYEVYVCNG